MDLAWLRKNIISNQSRKYFFDNDEEIMRRSGLQILLYGITLYKIIFLWKYYQILKNINTISNIPSYMVQGRYDLICPPINAYNLSRIGNAWVFVNTVVTHPQMKEL